VEERSLEGCFSVKPLYKIKTENSQFWHFSRFPFDFIYIEGEMCVKTLLLCTSRAHVMFIFTPFFFFVSL